MRKPKWWQHLGPDEVSAEWCCGIVTGANRFVDKPQASAYSRAVQARIMAGEKPRLTVVDIQQWRKTA